METQGENIFHIKPLVNARMLYKIFLNSNNIFIFIIILQLDDPKKQLALKEKLSSMFSK